MISGRVSASARPPDLRTVLGEGGVMMRSGETIEPCCLIGWVWFGRGCRLIDRRPFDHRSMDGWILLLRPVALRLAPSCSLHIRTRLAMAMAGKRLADICARGQCPRVWARDRWIDMVLQCQCVFSLSLPFARCRHSSAVVKSACNRWPCPARL